MLKSNDICNCIYNKQEGARTASCGGRKTTAGDLLPPLPRRRRHAKRHHASHPPGDRRAAGGAGGEVILRARGRDTMFFTTKNNAEKYKHYIFK